MPHFHPRCAPVDLVEPRRVDPVGLDGPTPGQARGPHWRRSSPGLYVPTGTARTVEQRILEAARRLPRGGAVTGWAALRLAGAAYFDGLAPDGRTPRRVPLLVPAGGNLRALGCSSVSRRRVAPDELRTLHGVPCVTPYRALYDETRALPQTRDAVIAVDMAAAAGVVNLAEYGQFARAQGGLAGARTARSAVALAVSRSRSPGESRTRLIWVVDAGLPFPRCNWPIADLAGRQLGVPDLICDELGVVGEYDGADHRRGSRHASDVEREGRFRSVGLEYFTVVGQDCFDIPKVVARMHAACDRARAANRPRAWLLARDPGPL